MSIFVHWCAQELSKKVQRELLKIKVSKKKPFLLFLCCFISFCTHSNISYSNKTTIEKNLAIKTIKNNLNCKK